MIEKFSNAFALGIIDKDKKEIDYLQKFHLVIEFEELFLFKHHTLPHFIIQISPDIERFFLRNAKLAGLNMSDYDLPTDLDKLKKQSKTVLSKNDLRFKKLFKSINKKGTPQFTKLTKWITYLKEQNYQTDLDELKNL